MRKLLTVFVCHLLFLTTACTNQDVDPDQAVETNDKFKSVHANDGILVFGTATEFEEFSRGAVLADVNTRLDLERRLGYSSLTSVVESKQKQGEREIQKFVLDNDLVEYKTGILLHKLFSQNIANLVNSDGFVIIGGSLFRFTPDKVSSVAISKTSGIPNAKLALLGKSDLKSLVKSYGIGRNIKSLSNPEARYNLGNNQLYVQSAYIRTGAPLYNNGFFSRNFEVELAGIVQVSSFGYWYEWYDEYEPYNEDCRCESGIGTPHVDNGYAAYVKIIAELYKRYPNNDIERNETASYLRVKSTNATLYADGVAIPLRYDSRVNNVHDFWYEVWSQWKPYVGGSRTAIEVEGNFDFEGQLQRNGRILTTTVNL